MPDFKVVARWTGDRALEIEPTDGPALAVSSPAKFGGDPEHWTPEDLLLGALQACLIQTFLHFVKQRKLVLKACAGTTEADFEKTKEGLRFTSVRVRMSLRTSASDQVEALREAMETAERYCPVSNALRTPIAIDIDVAVSSGPDAAPSP